MELEAVKGLPTIPSGAIYLASCRLLACAAAAGVAVVET